MNEKDSIRRLNREVKEIKNSKEYRLSQHISTLKNILCGNADKEKLGILKRVIKSRLSLNYYRANKIIKHNISLYNSKIEKSYKKKIAIYTCLTGGYDAFIEPLYTPDNVDFFAITDAEVPNNSTWKKIDINVALGNLKLSNAEKSRFFKIMPHKVFGEYEYSIYIDANIFLVGDVSDYIGYINSLVPMAAHWHPSRNSVYSEATVCKLLGKGNARKIDEQMLRYRKEGFPDDFGLVECNFMVRKHNDKRVIEIMELWWKEYLNSKSGRDQLSLPYAFWKNGYNLKSMSFIPGDVRDDDNLRLEWHL